MEILQQRIQFSTPTTICIAPPEDPAFRLLSSSQRKTSKKAKRKHNKDKSKKSQTKNLGGLMNGCSTECIVAPQKLRILGNGTKSILNGSPSKTMSPLNSSITFSPKKEAGLLGKVSPLVMNGFGSGHSTVSTLHSFKPGIGEKAPEAIRPLVDYSDSESDEDNEAQCRTVTAEQVHPKSPVQVNGKIPARIQNGTTAIESKSNVQINGIGEKGVKSPEKCPKSPRRIVPQLVASVSEPAAAATTITNGVYGPQLPPGFQRKNGEILNGGLLGAKPKSVEQPSTSHASPSTKPSLLYNGEFGKKELVAVDKKPSLIPTQLLKKSATVESPNNRINAFGPKLLQNNQEKKILINLQQRKNGEIKGAESKSDQKIIAMKRSLSENHIDGPAVQRRRLLSERSEEERKHPIIDSSITQWKWTNNNTLGPRRFGAGLSNHMNDCFMNAVVQVITHTSPLAHFIVAHKRDPQRCKGGGEFCVLCKLGRQIRAAFNENRMFNTMVKMTKHFFKSHHRGQQADAHEALLLLLDAIDSIALPGLRTDLPNTNRRSKSTPSEQIFGMTLRYRGQCGRCGKENSGYERVRVLELCMDKWRPTDVPQLLQRFFKLENLHDYKCEKCNTRGAYTRRTQMLRAPAVLILQIQRFAFMRKVKEEVIPNMTIDLLPYLVDKETSDLHGPAQYVLRGVVDHLGWTIDSGHYRCFHTDIFGEQWVEFDDDMSNCGRKHEQWEPPRLWNLSLSLIRVTLSLTSHGEAGSSCIRPLENLAFSQAAKCERRATIP